MVGFIYNYCEELIFCLAILNAILGVSLFLKNKKTTDVISPRGNIANGSATTREKNYEEISEMEKAKKSSLGLYTFYSNITAVFPLLGILGTVAAMINSSEENLMADFNVALSTTLWGVFFAILFKVFDSGLSAPLENNIETIDHVVNRYRDGLIKRDEHDKQTY